MAYGKIKADTLIYDNSGSDVEVTLASIGNKAPLASPTFTGTVTIPTPSSGDDSTKAASTAFVVAGFAPKASPALTGTATGVNLTLSGNLTVNGTTTTINSTTLTVDDKNIELGTVDTPSDTTADGGGITLKGATDKTFNWVDATDAWTSSEHIHLGDNKRLLVGTGSDLEIWHDGSNSYIKDGGIGDLIIRASEQLKIQETVNGETMAVFTKDGAAELYHNNVKKIETTAAGVTVTGAVTDDKGNVRSIPINTQSSSATYVAATSDAGKTIHAHSTTQTVELSGSAGFSSGDAVTIVNGDSTTLNITATNSLSLRNSADAATGNRALAQYGMATVYFTSATVAYISGAGLS